MSARSVRSPLAILGTVLALAACGGAATPTPVGGGGGGSTASSPAAGSAAPAGGGGANGYEGSVASAGLYAATWTANPGTEANPFNAVGNLTLRADKGAYGNIAVKPDGSVSFGSGAPEFGKNLSFDGTGAKVTLDPSGQFVCAFTVDADLKGHTDNAVLHLSGTMTVHWHPLGVGDLNCP
jgi:hypothetical protein